MSHLLAGLVVPAYVLVGWVFAVLVEYKWGATGDAPPMGLSWWLWPIVMAIGVIGGVVVAIGRCHGSVSWAVNWLRERRERRERRRRRAAQTADAMAARVPRASAPEGGYRRAVCPECGRKLG